MRYIFNKRKILGILISLFVSVFLYALISTYVGQFSQVNGKSMSPTFKNGDFVFINKIEHYMADYKRGDIIVFNDKNKPDNFYIKRIIAVAGDTVKIISGKIYVNDKILNENYIDVPTDTEYPVSTVPENSLFVLGDNRHPKASYDSRYKEIGFVSYHKVAGKVDFKATFMNKIALYFGL